MKAISLLVFIVGAIVVLMSVIVVEGCANTPDTLAYPPAFAEGYEHGCQTGQFRSTAAVKDVNRFNADRHYAHGWTEGRRVCETERRVAEADRAQSVE